MADFKNVLLVSFVAALLVGCGTMGKSGTVDLPIQRQSVQSSDKVIFQSAFNKSWVQVSLDNLTNSKNLFSTDFDIIDGSRDGSIILLLKRGRYELDPKNSDFYVYESNTGKLEEIPTAASGYQYDRVVLSPNKKEVAASASTPNLFLKGPHKYDDSVYIIDIQSKKNKKLKNHWGDAQVTDIYWSVDGRSILNRALTCGDKASSCKGVYLKRNIAKDSVVEVPASMFRIPMRVLDPKGECEGRTVEAEPVGEQRYSPHDVHIVVREKNGSTKNLITIKNRVESTPHSKGIPSISPQFTSNCKFITFSLGEDIFVLDDKGEDLNLLGRGYNPLIFE